MERKRISAVVIADSINQNNERITTMIFTLPRIVLAELNTHRALSKNSASSRAIPFEKMREMVLNDPFIPIAWQKDHKGMQGTEYFEESRIPGLTERWIEAAKLAVKEATMLTTAGVTKQLCNRMLEPYMWHTVIITGTEWENFFALRAHPQAEIHIAKLAEEALEAMNQSTPKSLKEGEWHIPFGDTFDEDRLFDLFWRYFSENRVNQDFEQFEDVKTQLKIKIATARCARISYNNFEGKDDYEADVKLHDVLLSSGHCSPFEHIAQNVNDIKSHSNFTGWLQYRKTLTNENQSDSRLIKKKYQEKA